MGTKPYNVLSAVSNIYETNKRHFWDLQAR